MSTTLLSTTLALNCFSLAVLCLLLFLLLLVTAFRSRGRGLALLGVRRLLHLPLLLCCRRLLIKLGLVGGVDLAPHLAEDLGHLADACVRVLLPHRGSGGVHKEEVEAQEKEGPKCAKA